MDVPSNTARPPVPAAVLFVRVWTLAQLPISGN